MTFQQNVSESIVGVSLVGDGTVNIEGDLIVNSPPKKSFPELALPRLFQPFKGRESYMEKLDALFFEEKERKIVITGLPGFGKTELAKQYAAHCLKCKVIKSAFWINADTIDNLKTIHKILQEAYDIYKRECCLYIFDNGVSRRNISFCEPPENENFLLLITSVINDWGDDIKQVALEPLNLKTSIDVFKEILSYRYQPEKEDLFEKMATFMSNVPLGLQIIAGYLRVEIDALKGKFDFNRFVEKITTDTTYKKRMHPSLSNSYHQSIFQAMSISLDRMNEEEYADPEIRELTCKMLCICSFLNPDRIPIEDITKIMEDNETITVDWCVYLSKNFSFIDYYEGYIKLHRLCQDILRLYFDKITEDCYSACMRWLLQDEYNLHAASILMQADDNKAIVKNIYEINADESHIIKRLLILLVEHGCSKCIEIIFNELSTTTKEQYVKNFKLLCVAALRNQVETLELLVPYGDIYETDDYDQIPYDVAKNNKSLEARKFIFEYECKTDQICKNKLLALHRVAFEGDVNVARKLLDIKVDVHARDSKGYTALHVAAEQGNTDIVKMLLDCGIDANTQAGNGATTMYWTAWESNVRHIPSITEYGSFAIAGDCTRACTALHLAARESKVDVVRLLLEHGANVNTRNSDDWTALHYAAKQGNIDTVQVLLEHDADIHATSQRGRTALHVAAWGENMSIVQILLEHGADIHVQENNGWTALDMVPKENYSLHSVLQDYKARADKNMLK